MKTISLIILATVTYLGGWHYSYEVIQFVQSYLPIETDHLRPILHFVGYGAITGAVLLACPALWWITPVVVMLLAGLEEWRHQFVDGRVYDLNDLMINLWGIITAIFVWMIYTLLKKTYID